MIRPDLSLPIPDDIDAAHFIGIGGSGMSGLARMFLERGIRVSGSDRADSKGLRELAELGATVYVGHDACESRRRRRHRRAHRCHLARESRVPAGQAARAARDPPLAGAVLADRRAAARVCRRRSRQDDVDGHDRHGAARSRHRPDFRERRRHRAARRVERQRPGRPLRHRSRRVGRHLPAVRHVDRAHHQRGPRPPRPLGHARRLLRRVRPVRERGARGGRDLVRRRRAPSS